MKMIKNSGIENLINYITSNSKLKKDEFAFTLPNEKGNSHLLLAKKNKMIHLGEFFYGTFVRAQYGNIKKDEIAIQKFLDLCIKKAENPTIVVPRLGKKPENWDQVYK